MPGGIKNIGFQFQRLSGGQPGRVGREGGTGRVGCRWRPGSPRRELSEHLAQQGEKMCPSYRGTFYRMELERLAEQTANYKADFLTCDIELFGGVQNYTKNCMRCRADFDKSGCKDWNEWCLRKGAEMPGAGVNRRS